MTDEPLSGLEKAVFWVEYVIRHKGAKYLTSPLKDISWYKFLLLDVITLLFIVCLALFLSFYKVVALLLRSCISRPNKFKLKEN